MKIDPQTKKIVERGGIPASIPEGIPPAIAKNWDTTLPENGIPTIPNFGIVLNKISSLDLELARKLDILYEEFKKHHES